MCGLIGDPIEKLEVCFGSFTCLMGPNSFIPISALSKKQTCVSHSTPEAELVAVDTSFRNEGIPALNLWEILNNSSREPHRAQATPGSSK